MTSPVDTLKALRGRVGVDVRGDVFLPCGRREPGDTANVDAALDTAIAALSAEQIRTVMRIEHEGRTFSVDSWAGPMVLGWRDAALSRGEAEPIGWVFQHEDTGRMTFCENDGVNNAESFAANNPRHMLCGPAYTTPRAVGDGWRPIESAPKDGTFVLTFAPRRTWATNNIALNWFEKGCWQKCNHACPPSHWMPIPAAPGPMEQI